MIPATDPRNKRLVNINFGTELFNPVYFEAFKFSGRFLVLYGSAGSGKSYFAAQKLVIRMLREPGATFLVARKVSRTIRNSCFALLKHIISEWKLTDYFTAGESEMTITCRLNNSRIISAGLDDVEKLKSIFNVSSAWVEEATEVTAEDIEQINLRLRGETPGYKQIILSFNPILDTGVHEMFFQNVKHPERTLIVHTTYEQNRFVDDEYRGVLEDLKDTDETFWKIYAKGQFAPIKGLIFPDFRVIQRSAWPAAFNDRFYGLDFGFTAPTSLLDIGWRDVAPRGQVYIDQQIYLTGLTNSDLIAEMKKLGISRRQPIYADSAEPDRIAEISSAGFLIYPADKDVAVGIDFCKRFEIYSLDTNVESNREFKSYKWREDRAGRFIDGEPVNINNHSCDAFRYGTYTRLRNVIGKVRAPFKAVNKAVFGRMKF